MRRAFFQRAFEALCFYSCMSIGTVLAAPDHQSHQAMASMPLFVLPLAYFFNTNETLDKSKLIGTFDKVPTRDEISEPLNEQLVVELYSK